MAKIKKPEENELINARKELAFQNEEKEKRAAELGIANKELAFQDEEKEKRAAVVNVATPDNLELRANVSCLSVVNSLFIYFGKSGDAFVRK